MTWLTLEGGYEHVVRTQLIEIVEQLSAQDLATRVNSVVLTSSWPGVPRLMGLKGLGKEIWRDEDAQAYVNRLRQGWR